MFGQGSPPINRRDSSIIRMPKRVLMVLMFCCASSFSGAGKISNLSQACLLSATQQAREKTELSVHSSASDPQPIAQPMAADSKSKPRGNDLLADGTTESQKRASEPEIDRSPTIRLRIYWGGGTPQLWNGSVRLKQGSFSNPQVLGVTADAAASVLAVHDQLQIKHWSATSFGGIDIDVPYSVGNQLELSLSDGLQSEQPLLQATVPLSDLLHDSYYKELDATGNRILITRTPGDFLPVQISRPHLIFEPEEAFEFLVSVNRSQWSLQKANCRVRWQPLNSTDSHNPLAAISPPKLNAITSNQTNAQTVSFDIDAEGSAAAQTVRLTMPREEGVYQLTLELAAPWQQASFKSRTTVRRQIQVVVLHSRAPAADATQPWKQIESIDPTVEPSATSNSLLSLGLKPNSANSSLSNEQRRTVTIDGNPMLELDVGGWLAVPLSFQQLDRPHLIEIEYLADGPASLGFSLLEPDSGGQIPVYGTDSGLYVPASLIEVYPKTASRNRQRHQIVVWPQENSSHLLIANRDHQHPATIGKVEVFTGPARLSSTSVNSSSKNSPTNQHESIAPIAPVTSPKNRRHFMVFSEQGLFAKNFGGPEAIDAAGNMYSDWETFLRGADRLVQHLKTNEYSGAFLTVAVDGSTLYPSTILGNSPRLDTGLLSSVGADPLRKDVLELLFRMFEREGLTLIPALVFNGPLPAIEASRAQSAESGLATRPVHWNGSKADLKIADHFPIYNPLNPTVQSQVNSAISELSARYQRYDCFGGIAIVCRPDTYAILPGQQWCCDVETFSQFWQATQGDEALLGNREQLVQQIMGPQQDRWLQWRADRMAKWYQTLAQSLQQHRPDAKLFLAPVDLYNNEELAAVLSPSLHSAADFSKQMLRLGWDVEQLAALKEVSLLKPRRLAPNQSLADNRIEVSLENQLQSDAFYNQARAIGDLHVNRISWAHFSQLEEAAVFESQRNAIMRLQPLTPAGMWNRQRFLNSLRASDSQFLVDGGALVSQGQEAELLEFRKLFHQLPAVPFADVNPVDSIMPNQTYSPVVVRQHLANDGLWFYAVNPSPWPCKVQLKIPADPSLLSSMPLRIRQLSTAVIKEVSGENGAMIELEMEPISLTGGVIQRRDVGANPQANSIESFRFELPPQAADQLRKQVHVLQSKLLKSTNSQPLDVLSNSYFVVNDQPSLAGWEMGQQGTRGISLIDENPLKGQACLRLKNDEPSPVWIRSNPFNLPETGRLSISVWLRTTDPSQQPPLRISVEGVGLETNYYRFGSIGSLATDRQSNQLNDQWQRFAVHFDDLPVGRLSQVRIGLDLMGPGVVDVDQFEVFDRWFDERDAKAINQRLASSGPLLANPLTYESCRILLGSYWLRFLDEHFREQPTSQIAGGTAGGNPLKPLTGSATELAPGSSATAKSASDASASDASETKGDLNDRGLFRRLRRGNRVQR